MHFNFTNRKYYKKIYTKLKIHCYKL